MKVIIIEDDYVLCDAYRYYFSSYTEYTLKAIYKSIEDALDEFENTRPEIIVTDISLVGSTNGIQGISHFKAIDPYVKVLVISVHNGLEWIKGALSNQADGYLSKPINKKSLFEGLNAVRYEGAVMSNDIVKKVISTFHSKSLNIFSIREREIVSLLRQGETYKSIGEKLHVSVSTVSFHIQNIYFKLDVNSKAEALKRLRQIE